MRPNSPVGTLRRRTALASARSQLPTYSLGNTMETKTDSTIDSPTDYLGNTSLKGMATDWLPSASMEGVASLATLSFLGAGLIAYIRWNEYKAPKSPWNKPRLMNAAKWGAASMVTAVLASGAVSADQRWN